MLLENKTAVIYGAGGNVGGAVARAFAGEGARVFLAGRTRSSLEAVAGEIADAGGTAEAAEVDALDERAVDEHADDIAARAGGIDVSFNSIGHGDVHGLRLLDMPFEDFWRPIAAAVRSQFLTTRAAARHMILRGSGVVLAITASTARHTIPNVGGTGVAFDAIESQCRQWACELGRRGVRVAWLQTSGVSDAISRTVERFPDYGLGSMRRDELISWLEGKSMLGRLTTLADVGAVAAFVASDRAAAITGTGVDLTCGSIGGR